MSRPALFPNPLRAVLFLGIFAGVAAASGQQPATSPPASTPPPLNASPRPANTPPGGDYQPPRPLKRPPLSYPELAKLNRIQGLIRVLFTVDETGKVTDLEPMSTSGSLLLDQVLREPGLREYVFQPATLNGKPVTGTYEQELEFKLDPEEQRTLGLRRSALAPTAGTPDPPYPETARLKGLRGRVVIAVQWGDNGLVDHISLQASSGNALLDVTALRWAYEHWRVDRAQIKEPQFVKTVVFEPGGGAPAPAATPVRR